MGCGLDVAMEEVDLRSQHVGEACSAFVDVVLAAGAAEQFGPRCLAGGFERGGAILSASGTTSSKGTRTQAARRTGRRQEKAEQRPCCDAVVPWRPVLRGHELLPERAVRRGADGQLPRPFVTYAKQYLGSRVSLPSGKFFGVSKPLFDESYRTVSFRLLPPKAAPILPLGKMPTMIANAADFGVALTRARKNLGLTQRDLAVAIGVGERFIVDLEAGKPTAQLGKALAAAKACGMRLADCAEPGPSRS